MSEADVFKVWWNCWTSPFKERENDLVRDALIIKPMNDKYYTPDISDFHVGFEFEMDAGTGWAKQTFPDPWWRDGGMGGIKTLENCVSGKNVRVKVLDREDIESLGWVFGLQYKDDGYYSFGDAKLLHSKSGTIKIIFKEKYHLFKGEIKNKSQLKLLMQQIGII